jgi:hypothetical protein
MTGQSLPQPVTVLSQLVSQQPNVPFAQRVRIRSVTAEVKSTRTVEIPYAVERIYPLPTRSEEIEIRSGSVVVRRHRTVLSDGSAICCFERELDLESDPVGRVPDEYRVWVRLLAPYEYETVTVVAALEGGGASTRRQVVEFGVSGSKQVSFDFSPDDVVAPNRVSVTVVGGETQEFDVDLPRADTLLE